MAYCNFTTVHSGGKFVGRSAEVNFQSENTLEQVYKDLEEIKSLCVQYIRSQKPKWNIFMIDVTNIQDLTPR
jgi:uncharacterized pyridoxamine 5'-phosphate oxidase family protein